MNIHMDLTLWMAILLAVILFSSGVLLAMAVPRVGEVLKVLSFLAAVGCLWVGMSFLLAIWGTLVPPDNADALSFFQFAVNIASLLWGLPIPVAIAILFSWLGQD